MSAPSLDATVPNLTAPAVDPATGILTPSWRSFFRRFGAGAPPIQAVPVGSSPLGFVAPGPGHLVLVGGSGVSVVLERGRVSIAIPGALVPVATNDAVSVTFGAPPTVYFLPRIA